MSSAIGGRAAAYIRPLAAYLVPESSPVELATLYTSDLTPTRAPASALARFRRLRRVEDIPDFVRACGTLNVTVSGRPAAAPRPADFPAAAESVGFRPECAIPGGDILGRVIKPDGRPGAAIAVTGNVESAEMYLTYAKLLDAAVRLAFDLRDGRIGSAEQAALILEHLKRDARNASARARFAAELSASAISADDPSLRPNASATAVEIVEALVPREFPVAQIAAAVAGSSGVTTKRAQIALVETFVNWWLIVGGVAPRLGWATRGEPSVIWPESLWGALGAELFTTVLRAPGKLCAICRARSVVPPRRAYCGHPDCLAEVNRRDVARWRKSRPASRNAA